MFICHVNCSASFRGNLTITSTLYVLVKSEEVLEMCKSTIEFLRKRLYRRINYNQRKETIFILLY